MKVVIVVNAGGVISSVLSKNEELEVEILDYGDCEDEPDEDALEAELDARYNAYEAEGFKAVY